MPHAFTPHYFRQCSERHTDIKSCCGGQRRKTKTGPKQSHITTRISSHTIPISMWCHAPETFIERFQALVAIFCFLQRLRNAAIYTVSQVYLNKSWICSLEVYSTKQVEKNLSKVSAENHHTAGQDHL